MKVLVFFEIPALFFEIFPSYYYIIKGITKKKE